MRFFENYTVKDCLEALLVAYPFSWINISTKVAFGVFQEKNIPEAFDGWGYISFIEYLGTYNSEVLSLPARIFFNNASERPVGKPYEIAKVYVEVNSETGFLFIMSDQLQ